MLLILIASLAPQAGEFQGIPNIDKFLHFSVYLIAAFYLQQVGQNRSLAKVVIGVFLYSAAIEVLQGQTADRSAEWLDLLANLAGILCGSFISLKALPNFLNALDQILIRLRSLL